MTPGVMGDLHADDADLPARDELGVARPGSDRVEMETVRARAEQALFGAAAPARIGRFEIVGRIAGGGMGVVYEASDPQLGRKVALKVLHPRAQDDERARQRLIAEAQALARLDHPGVVKVHDVVIHEGQVVIVMELLAGLTLAAWERARPRGWREVVDLYLRAGEGLAAAHGVGVIHRDFKPANVIVGDDCRVRVLDFGLARFAGAADVGGAGEDAGRAALGAGDLTATGDVIGTLGFTAPEQLAGEVATEAADQFSFCVALHRAVEGTPPFEGLDIPALLASIRAGERRMAPDGRRLPPWLRDAVGRGLEADPSRRFPSMSALLAELGRPRGWRRWRVPVLVAGAMVLVGATAAAILTRPSTADPLAGCDSGRTEIAAVWNDARRAEVRGALARFGTGSNDEPRVLGGLDTYAAHWTDLHRAACVEHGRGLQSDDLLDRRMICMRQRLGDLTASIQRLTELDGHDPDSPANLVAKLPALDACAEAERLQAEYPPPGTPELRAQVAALRARLSDASALERAGRAEEATAATAGCLADARRLEYPPVIAEAALLDGHVRMQRSQFRGAIASVSEARSIALRHDLTSIAIEAGARAIFLEGIHGEPIIALEHDIRLLEPLSATLPATDRFARPLLLNNMGVAYMGAQRRADATKSFQEAREALSGLAPEAVATELTCIDKNLAMVTPDATERERLARSVWEIRRARLGEGHLETLDALDSYAHYVRDPARALPLAREECAIYGRLHPDETFLRVACAYYLGLLAEEAGTRDEAVAAYREVEQLAGDDPNVESWLWLSAGRSRLLTGDHAGARPYLLRVIERDGKSKNWWQFTRSFDAEVSLATIDAATGDLPTARRRLSAAIAGYRAVAELNEDSEAPFRLAGAQRQMAALDPGGHGNDRSRAVTERP
jgi:tetratricopeptide (TPR) repeat protein/predicted Ser/Thr protein kinase